MQNPVLLNGCIPGLIKMRRVPFINGGQRFAIIMDEVYHRILNTGNF